MKYLNLSKGFNPYNSSKEDTIEKLLTTIPLKELI